MFPVYGNKKASLSKTERHYLLQTLSSAGVFPYAGPYRRLLSSAWFSNLIQHSRPDPPCQVFYFGFLHTYPAGCKYPSSSSLPLSEMELI